MCIRPVNQGGESIIYIETRTPLFVNYRLNYFIVILDHELCKKSFYSGSITVIIIIFAFVEFDI